MSWRVFGESFVTMVVIMDPVGNAPVFMTLTAPMEQRRRRATALQATLAAGGLIFGFALFGEVILRYLKVDIESLSIAGGLLLLLVALEMLREQEAVASDTPYPAFVPLATPLLAGPGAVATAMLLARTNTATNARLSLVGGIAAAVIVVGVVLIVADQVSRLFKPAAIHFLTRVFGLLLATIAVQLVVDAVRSLVRAG